MVRYALVAFLAAVPAAVPSTAVAQVYRCTASDGSTTFQQTPCAAGQQPLAPSRTAPDAPPRDDELVQTTLLMKQGCDAVVPGFAARSATAFAAWRNVRAAALARVEASDDYRRELTESRRLLLEPRSSTDVSDMQAYCDEQLLPLLAKEGTPPDPRFRTPERTFSAFVTALRAGDREAALACLGDLVAEEARADLAGQPVEKLREVGNSFVGTLVLKELLGPLQTAAARRRDGTDYTLFFDREPNGNWKLAGI
jgi:hypothetical protein